jgi:hypothetical protein
MELELFTPHNLQRNILDACLSEDVFFVTAVVGRQFGKTMMGQNLAAFWALNEENIIVYWVSPTASQAQKVYKELSDALIETGVIASKKQMQGDTEIVFYNGSKILFRSAASEDSLRGQSVHYLIVDEAAFIKRETVETIILPMLNVRGKKCLFLTTPKGKNYVYDYYLKGLQGEKKWKSFKYSTYDSPLANDELINMFKNTMPPKLFQQEIEAEFVDSSGVFSNINELCILPKLEAPQPTSSYWAGIDIGLVNDAAVLSIVDESGSVVGYYRWQNIEAPDLINKLEQIIKQWKFKSVLIETNNQGLGIYQDLRKRVNNLNEFSTTSKSKPEIINNLIHKMNTKEILLPNDELLKLEFSGFIFKQNDNGHIKYMADNGYNDDIVMATAIAVWCHQTKKSGKVTVYQL